MLFRRPVTDNDIIKYLRFGDNSQHNLESCLRKGVVNWPWARHSSSSKLQSPYSVYYCVCIPNIASNEIKKFYYIYNIFIFFSCYLLLLPFSELALSFPPISILILNNHLFQIQPISLKKKKNQHIKAVFFLSFESLIQCKSLLEKLWSHLKN